jgi:hypothetical protein
MHSVLCTSWRSRSLEAPARPKAYGGFGGCCVAAPWGGMCNLTCLVAVRSPNNRVAPGHPAASEMEAASWPDAVTASRRGLPGSNAPMSKRPPAKSLHGSAGWSMRCLGAGLVPLSKRRRSWPPPVLRDGEVRFNKWQEKVTGPNAPSLRVAAALRCSPEMSRRLQEVRLRVKGPATAGGGGDARPRRTLTAPGSSIACPSRWRKDLGTVSLKHSISPNCQIRLCYNRSQDLSLWI